MQCRDMHRHVVWLQVEKWITQDAYQARNTLGSQLLPITLFLALILRISRIFIGV